MRPSVRNLVSGLVSLAFLAAIPVPASADPIDETLSADAPSTFDLPDGGEAVFNPTDPRGVGATVEVTPIDTTGATAVTPDGEVVALGGGVDITATSPSGEDITTLEHEVTIIPPEDEGSPATDEMTPAIELTFPVSPEDIAGIDLATLGVYARESAGDPWAWVPSAYNSALGAVVAQSDHLSEFTVMGAPAGAAPDPTVPRIALDPDNDVGYGWWDGNREGELEYSYAVAVLVKEKLEETCQAEVLITRDSADPDPIVLPTTRADLISNFDADMSITLAFNDADVNGPNQPWGSYGDGGVVTYAEAGDDADINFTKRFNTIMPGFTYRPNSQGPRLSSTLLPYKEFDNVSGVHAHVELLFINHNWDWPVIQQHLDWVANGVVKVISDQIEATPGIACVEPIVLPAPPTQAEIDEVRQLGYNNYQRYGTDPVNLSTGNFVTSEGVFTLTGVGDQAIDLELAYNALDGRASQVGNGWNFAYSSRAQQYANGSILVTLADGRSVYFESDGAGGFVMPAGARSSLAATETGVRLMFGDGTSLEFTVDEETGYGELTRAVDRQGNAYTLAYGPLAEAGENEIVFPPLTSITDEAGQTVAVTSTPEGRITAFTHPDGRVWTLAYDDAGNLVSLTDGAGRTRSFAYNDAGLLDVVTGADGVDEITNDYDDEMRVVAQTDGAGNVRTIAYGENRSTTLTDALGNASVITHNDKGQATASRDAEGGLTLTGYDENSNPVTSIDANGNVYTSTFDAYGRVATSTNPLGETTVFGYNSVGDLTSITTPDGEGGTATTSFVLNGDGRAVETHLPDGTVTYATYNEHGDVTSLTDALGNVTRFVYDSRGNTIRVTDPLGGTTTSVFDLANRATSTTDALGSTTTFVYDTSDNLLSVTDALGQVTSFTYDETDSLVSMTDAVGYTTTYEHNVNLQLTAENRPDGTRVTYEYDAEHHLVRQVNADGTSRSWEYDGLGRATVMVDEKGDRWVTEYDAIGNPLAAIDPEGNQTETTFDMIGRPVGWTDALGNQSAVTYNTLGLVTSSTDELGRVTVYDFDVMGKLLETTTPDGVSTSFDYDANGNLTSLTNGRGFTTLFEYDALGRQTTMVDALGDRSSTEYDAVGNVTATMNPLGARTEFAYDALSRMVGTTNALGGQTAATYDPLGNTLTRTDELGHTVSFGYDPMGRVTTAVQPDGGATTYEYDLVGNLIRETNPRGYSIGHEYDAIGFETARIDEVGQRWLTEYDTVGNATATVDPTGARTEVEYDALGRPVATIDALHNRTSIAYNPVGAVVASTDALGETTAYGYDVMNRLTTVTTPEGAVTAYGYDANGNTTTITNARGDVLGYEYDAVDQPVVQVAPDGGRTVTTFDAAGNATAITDPVGAVQGFGYDLLGRVTSQTDGEGFVRVSAYDAVGNLVSATDGRGATTAYTYDVRNRQVLVTNAEGESTATGYDLAGNIVSTTNPIGVVTRYTYDPRNLLTSTTENFIASQPASASVNVTTGIGYDVRGQATVVTDARGNATVYAHDAVGRVVSETDALGRVTGSEFDAVGRPVVVTAADGSVTRTSYTPDGYVAEVQYPGQTVRYGYDEVGNRVSMSDNLGVSSWVYDWAGRVVSETDARDHTTTYSYNLTGNITGLVYPDGRIIERTVDGRGLTVTQTDAAGTTAFSFDGAGWLTGEVRPTGVSTEISRDLVGRVTSIVYTGEGVTGNLLPSGAVNPSSAAPGNAYGHCKANGNGHPNQQPAGCSTGTLAFGYTYDDRGLVVERDVSTGSTAADAVTTETLYTHDALGRLTRSVTGNVTAAYGWDAASNLVSEVVSDDASTAKTGDGYTVTRTVNAGNQLVSLVEDPVLLPAAHTTTTRFTYDLRGNRTGEVTTTQTGAKTHTVSTVVAAFSGMDQLVSTTGPDGAASWVRDGLGRALAVTEDGTTRDRLFAGVQVVTDGSTAITRSPDGSVLTEASTVTTGTGKNETTTTSTVDVLTDLVGSPVATASGGVISADLALYGDFGDTWTTPKVDTVTGFTGHVETAGLVEFASRTYDPETRQWIQDDRYRGTVTRASSMNRYAYVEGAPESYVDIFGYFRAAAAIRAQQLSAVEAAYMSGGSVLAQVAPMCTGYGCFAAWQVEKARQAEMASQYNRARTLNSVYSAAELRNQITQSNGYNYGVAVNKKIVRDQCDANVSAYNKANDQGFLGGLVDTLSIVGHGVVNFGGGVVNALSDGVNFVVDVAQTTYNAASPLCWADIACASIGDIGNVPIYGDPSLYGWSQGAGYLTVVLAEFAIGGGPAFLKDLATGSARLIPRLVTDLPGVISDLGRILKNVPTALSEIGSSIVNGVSKFIHDPLGTLNNLRQGFTNNWNTPGGIFGTPTQTPATLMDDVAGPASDIKGVINPGQQVLVDTNAVLDRAAIEAIQVAGGTPVITPAVIAELRGLVARGQIRSLPSYLDDLTVIEDTLAVNSRITVRELLEAAKPGQSGLFVDGIIGANAIENGMPVLTNDKLLISVLRSLGVEVL